MWCLADPQLACHQKGDSRWQHRLTRRQITLDSLLTNFACSVGQVAEVAGVLQLCQAVQDMQTAADVGTENEEAK